VSHFLDHHNFAHHVFIQWLCKPLIFLANQVKWPSEVSLKLLSILAVSILVYLSGCYSAFYTNARKLPCHKQLPGLSTKHRILIVKGPGSRVSNQESVECCSSFCEVWSSINLVWSCLMVQYTTVKVLRDS